MFTKNCLVCGKSFEKPKNESSNNWEKRHKYCSRICVNRAPRSEKTRLKMRLKKLGKPSWNKGVPLSEIHKKALRKKHRKILDTSKYMGRRPWNKIGNGITPINERIRKSPKYKDWRKKVFLRDNYTCVFCGNRNRKGYKVILQADHIKPFALYPKLRFEVLNGRTLCEKCHRKTESYGRNQHTYPQFKSNKIAKNTNAA